MICNEFIFWLPGNFFLYELLCWLVGHVGEMGRNGHQGVFFILLTLIASHDNAICAQCQYHFLYVFLRRWWILFLILGTRWHRLQSRKHLCSQKKYFLCENGREVEKKAHFCRNLLLVGILSSVLRRYKIL